MFFTFNKFGNDQMKSELVDMFYYLQVFTSKSLKVMYKAQEVPQYNNAAYPGYQKKAETPVERNDKNTSNRW